MSSDNVPWICAGKTCLCAGEEYTCDCQAVVTGQTARCSACGTQLRLIDADTGAEIVHAQEGP